MIPQNLLRRYIAFTREDEDAWCDLLIARFPLVRFVPELTYDEAHSPDPPPIRVFRHINECVGGNVDFFFAPPGWTLVYDWHTSTGRHFWSMSSRSLFWPNGYWWRCKRKEGRGDWGDPEPPFINRGDIVFRARMHFPEELKTIRAAMRLTTKVATNKLAQLRIDDPGWPVRLAEKGKGFDLWAGHHALEWARQDPGRVVGPLRDHRDRTMYCAYRPLDAVPAASLAVQDKSGP
jgi:hypothetical protein